MKYCYVIRRHWLGKGFSIMDLLNHWQAQTIAQIIAQIMLAETLAQICTYALLLVKSQISLIDVSVNKTSFTGNNLFASG